MNATGGLSCTETVAPLDDPESWTGPSEEDVLAAVSAMPPTGMAWDELTLSGAESTLELTVTRTADPLKIVENQGENNGPYDCVPGQMLRIPVEVTFSMADETGGAAGVIRGALDALSADPAEIYFSNDGQYDFVGTLFGDAGLHGAWLDAAHADVAGQYGDEDPTFHLIFYQSWADAKLDVEARGETPDSSGFVSALWRGHWQAEEAP